MSRRCCGGGTALLSVTFDELVTSRKAVGNWRDAKSCFATGCDDPSSSTEPAASHFV
ncbi:MAG TPA: hypothetical protein VND89_01125 [Acidimicrobiales bacterium]|nr:hypothetical protein [Acidimicrobiales bacterium]